MPPFDNILDAPPPPEMPPSYKKRRRIAVALEIALWLFAGVSLLFFSESWPGSDEMLTGAFTALSLFYLLLTYLVTAAQGRQQINGAIGVGILLALRILGAGFVLEAWEGGREMLFLAVVLGGIAAIAMSFLLFMAMRGGKPVRFHLNVLVRMALIILIW